MQNCTNFKIKSFSALVRVFTNHMVLGLAQGNDLNNLMEDVNFERLVFIGVVAGRYDKLGSLGLVRGDTNQGGDI